MLIIIEGTDGVGKTTLARLLVRQIQNDLPGERVDYVHSGPPTGSPIDAYTTPLYDYRPGSRRHLVLDRWHLGELVYPRALGRSTTYDEPTHMWTEMFLRSRGALLVHVTDDPLRLTRRLRTRGDDMITPELAAGTVLTLFAAEFDRSTLHKIEVTTPQLVDDWSIPARRIITAARAVAIPAIELTDLVTYVGPAFPKRLLVGDRRGHGHDPLWTTSEPAFVPRPGTSGHYLFDTLFTMFAWDIADLFTRLEVGVINGRDVDDLAHAFKILRPVQVTALGRRAAEAVAAVTAVDGIGIRRVAHPQYVRRFHYPDIWEYATHIASGIEPTWSRP